MPFTRRSFLDTTFRVGTAVAWARLLPTPAAAAQEIARTHALIVRSDRPEDLETPAHLLNSWITPNDRFYVRSHFYTPAIEVAAWRLVIDGEVANPMALTLQEIKDFPSRTAVVTLECAGNGRAFFEPPVAGVQWERGAVGTAAWTGVRLSDLLRKAAVKPSARHLWLDGADRGIGRAPDFIRNLPMDKAMHPDTLLAYEMNGAPLPASHGFPLRAIVPGWDGAYSMKWLTHIEVKDREHDGAFVQAGYRYPRRRVSPGTLVSQAETVPLKDLGVKSLITSHATDSVVPPGPVLVSGFAWGGEAEIKQVEVSTDNGRTWARARLGQDRARFAWRAFEYVWQPTEPGSYVVLSRATDDRGRAQPIVADWNPGGYRWNAVDRVRLNVTAL